MNVMQNSPFLKEFKLLSKGSGNLRSQLTYLWHTKTLTNEQMKKPVLKGKRPRKRSGDFKSNKIGKSNIVTATTRTRS